MSEMIIERVIETVPRGSNLYNIGDVSFADEETTVKYLSRIKRAGINHHLILGNHDHRVKKSTAIRECFTTIQDYLEITRNKKKYFVMSHFPMSTWHRSHYGAMHLHGHCHSTYQPLDGIRRLDIGIDGRAAGDMKPYSLEEVLDILSHFPYGIHHDN